MVITLIGLSGCGKSHLAGRLESERGFTRRSCDGLIEERLSADLAAGGYKNIDGVAEWMGQPYEPRYREAAAKYLSAERTVMETINASLGDDGWGISENVVIDTSGSVIYTGEDVLQALKQRSRVIYLGIPESEFPFMCEQYFADPKPVIWNDVFRQNDGEAPHDALRRCYPTLIRERAKLYQRIADVTLVMNREKRDMISVLRILQLASVR